MSACLQAGFGFDVGQGVVTRSYSGSARIVVESVREFCPRSFRDALEMLRSPATPVSSSSQSITLTQADRDYLDSIRHVTASMKSDDEARDRIRGCPDPDFYADEDDWDFRDVLLPGD